MTNDEFKQILNEALDPINKDLQSVKGDLRSVKEDLQAVKRDLQEVKGTQENQVLPSVIHSETVLVGYADAYKTNKSNIERLDERVSELEENAGVTIDPALAIHR